MPKSRFRVGPRGRRRDRGSVVQRETRKARAQVMLEWVGAGPPLDHNRNVSQAGEWLEGVLDAVGIRGGLEEERVIESWRELAGELVASQTSPVSLRRGCLLLKVLQPAMRYHLEQLKPGLLRELQGKLGCDDLKTIRFTIG